jgi:DNA mismatch endonuclease (patch repair protein)
MADIVDRATRSRMMSGIRGKNTKPEVEIRKALFAEGFRYRLHVATLPGKPDIVLARHHAVILVHGCFWHGHDCALFKMPASNRDFWLRKIRRNKENDERVVSDLLSLGWRVLTIWECAFRGPCQVGFHVAVKTTVQWIMGDAKVFDIRSKT